MIEHGTYKGTIAVLVGSSAALVPHEDDPKMVWAFWDEQEQDDDSWQLLLKEHFSLTKPNGPSLADLTTNQARRLIEFKKEHGGPWKYKLNSAWQTGHDARFTDGHLLRQIRNQMGPTWLDNLSI